MFTIVKLLVFVLLCVGLAAAAEPSYYDVLEVGKYADSEQIKASYKKLARVWHPDLHEDKDLATEKMKQINEAKDTLMDASKREKYDRMVQRMQSVNSFAVVGELPTIVLIYFTCPVYFSFRFNTFIASFLCTSMLLLHIPALIACYLFYKYALWGPVPKEKREKMLRISIPVRVMMLFIISGFFAVFMISFTEYIPWLGCWILTPSLAMWAVDLVLCVGSKTEKKFNGPGGSPRMVTKTIHKRPEWLPFWVSLTDLMDAASDFIHGLDNDPEVVVESTRTAEYEYRYRKCDLEEERTKAEQLKQDKIDKKDKEAKDRHEKETLRREKADLIQKSVKKSTIEAVSQNSAAKKEPEKKVKPAPKPAAAKKGEVPNVTSTGSAAWTTDQQREFEKALRKAPSGTRDRWETIASQVEGKTSKECADRFKELSSLRTTLRTAK
eukprot:TRINITY_DN15508_c0_g1_i1.p1 TRINITY_DN15508_c0_g1~~TRINITY_DN15508_c0_g1_i1.p1  ORF type:complete len:439 (+),score=86.02 TRINITY_DN15508_c0_g1_i1:54-1370(+)